MPKDIDPANQNTALNPLRKFWERLNNLVLKIDKLNLWWVGLFVLAAVAVPFLILGEGSVFEIHDQLDETILTYILNAKYLGQGASVFPEMLGGVNASGMQPSAVLFVLLYRILPPLPALIIQYLIVCASGYMGMYFSLRKITGSNILAVFTAVLFCMLPIQPIYGLSVLGVPLVFYSACSLYEKKYVCLSLALVVFFGLTTHLVLIGYVIVGFWGLAIIILFFRQKINLPFTLGFLLLIVTYIITNWNLIFEFLFHSAAYTSHREELVNYASGFLESAWSLFINSSQHVPSQHKYLILPVVILLLLQGFCYKKLDRRQKTLYFTALGIFAVIILITLFYGFCKSEIVTNWKNSMTGFLRYFQAERFYWLYPSLWYLETGIVFSILWQSTNRRIIGPLIRLGIIGVLLLPTIHLIKVNSVFYMNVNQINNGSGITGYITWENYYSKDLMAALDQAIGKDKSTYRIAHLGISPAPSLMYGFYTIDGYSNNYPLDYKYEFRKIISRELEENAECRLYFDEWGSRLYLFNRDTGSYWLLSKKDNVKYQNIELDTGQMRNMGCEYLFSGGEILNAGGMGLTFLGYFETDVSYWGIWLYQLAGT